MKNKIILSMAFLMVLSSSCKKFLTQVPIDSVSPQSFYKTEADLTSSLMAVYNQLGNSNEATYSRFLALEASASNDEDYYKTNSTHGAWYNTNSSYSTFASCWADLYSGIEQANILLEHIDSSNAPQTVKDEIRGEALFLRAYYYFILTSYFGDVPLKLQSTQGVNDIKRPRTPMKDIFTQVINDMTTAEGLVKTTAQWGNTERVSKTCVEGILARVCLHAAGRLRDPGYYSQALSWGQKVVASGSHGLNPDYKQIFINESSDVYDLKECIWEVAFYVDAAYIYSEYERFGSTVGINNTNNLYGFMQGGYQCTGTYYNLFDPADLRRDWTIAPFYYNSNDASKGKVPIQSTLIWGRSLAKWRREYQSSTAITVKNTGPTNWPLLRYADVLLTIAEADNEMNGPTAQSIEYVNQVRRRGYGVTLAGRHITKIVVNNGGSGYTTAPTVTISGGGATRQAAATAMVSGGKIIDIEITDNGTFYASAPTITFSGGGGSGAIASATISNLTDPELTPSQYSSQSAFRQTIMDERSRELGGEGHRKLDLLRWHILIPTMQNMATIIGNQAPTSTAGGYSYVGRNNAIQPYNNFSARDTLFPIPIGELSLNQAIVQNPGW